MEANLEKAEQTGARIAEGEPPAPGRLNMRPGLIASAAALALMLAVSAWAWGRIAPDAKIPVHWGLDGKPDRYGGKFEGLFMMPLIFAGVSLLLAFVPKLEPRRAHFVQSQRFYLVVWIATAAFLAALHLILVAAALGREVDMNRVIPFGIGALFAVIGNYLGKVRSNFIFGVRTPWTLSSELAWDKTHRLAGRLFVAFGLATLVLGAVGFTAPSAIALGVAGAASLLGIIGYSYFVWRADPNKSAGGRA